jgi:hypothetical protein
MNHQAQNAVLLLIQEQGQCKAAVAVDHARID